MNPTKAESRVDRIYTNNSGCYIRLVKDGRGTPVLPKDRYFRIPINHPNYNAYYSLAMLAAVNNYVLWIRTVEDITPNEVATVSYLVITWAGRVGPWNPQLSAFLDPESEDYALDVEQVEEMANS